MRTIHPHAQPLRLATLDTAAGTSGRNEVGEETDEIFEEKKEIDEEDEKTDEVKKTTAGVGPQIKLDSTKGKNKRVHHSRKKNKEERKKNMDSTVIQWMSRG